MDIKNNIKDIQEELKAYNAKLIAVSKTQPPDKIREAYDAGQRQFGENKAQEMTAKQAVLPADIRWHMIGHLQTNKVKYIAPYVSLIHSVDSFRLLEEINKQGKKNHRVIPCLLQVHIAKEETKFGFSFEEVTELLTNPALQELQHIEICGLMGMATLTDAEPVIRNEFRSLKEFFDLLKSQKLPSHVRMEELSIGMTSDYQIALQEGSTMVRIGTAIFGARN
jgi:PLP dependent protein